jgi:2-oxoglutarate ferredoxin oxidoreductase subunit alpha
MRVRAFPFNSDIVDFVDSHEKVFVVEQNRDAQFRSLMMIEFDADPKKLIKVLNYDGTPITADNIYRQIKGRLG